MKSRVRKKSAKKKGQIWRPNWLMLILVTMVFLLVILSEKYSTTILTATTLISVLLQLKQHFIANK